MLALFDLHPPEIPEGGEHVWRYFWELHSGRGNSGFGPLPLSWAEMAAWAQTTGICLHPWLAAILKAMDGAWLAASAEKLKKRQT